MGQALGLVGGVVGAVAGSFVGMPQLGWLVGSAVGGYAARAFGPTNPGPKPQDMPNVNQALRGSPVFITFGTNRVYPQITWTKNWKASRMSGGKKGGGKGGGSGGAGAAKGGGAAGQSYEYSWDLIYNFGMMDVPAYPRTGWIGGDAMDETTLTAILAGHNAAQSQINPIFSALFPAIATKNQPKSKLNFAEVHYNPGFGTGLAELETWSYFQTQEGVATAWPNNTWVGFKTLQLGQVAVVPQLSFEFGPINADASANVSYVNDIIIGTDITSAQDFYIGTSFVLANSKHWIENYRSEGGSTYAFGLIAAEDNTKVLLTEVQFNADSPIGASWDIRTSFGIPGTPYIYVYMSDNATVSNYIMVYKLNDDETLSFIGYGQSKWGSQAYTTVDIQGVGVVEGNVYVATVQGIGLSTGKLSTIWSLGAVGSAPGDGGIVAAYWDNNIVRDITTAMGDYFFSSLATEGRVYQPVATFVDNGSGGYRMLVYVGKEDIDASTQSLILSLGGSNPNGFTVDDLGAVVFGSFDDAGKHIDGTSGANAKSEYVSPSYSVLNGVSYLIWCKQYWDSADIGAHGNAQYVRIYSWNGTTQTLVASDYTNMFEDGTLGVDNSNSSDPAHSFPRGTQLMIDSDGTIWYNIFYQGIQSITSRYITGTYGTLAVAAADVTPPYIINRILRDTVWGFSLTNVDQGTYLLAHQHCLDNGIVISATYTQRDNLLSIIDQLLSLYAGYLVDDGGTIKFGFQTTADTPDAVVVDNSRLVAKPGAAPVQVSKPAVQDGYNKIKFNYLDRKLDYKQNQIELADEVDIDINGPRMKEWPASYVMAGSLAQNIAERSLWTNLYGRDQYKFQLGPKDAHRQPGDLITLVDSFHPDLRSGVTARIIKWKESRRLLFDVEAVQYLGYQLNSTRSFVDVASNDPGNDMFKEIALAAHQVAYELPQEYQGAQPVVYFGYNQFSLVMGAQLHLSADGATFTYVDDAQPYIISGKMAGALENRPNGYVERDVKFYLMPGSNFTVATPTFCQTHAMDAISQGTRATGGGNFYVGSEMIAVEDLTLLSQNYYNASRVYRGWGGTPISAHNSGDFFHQHGGGILKFPITTDKIGTTFYYKIAPYNFAGDAVDITSITANTYTVTGMYWKPRIQPKSKLWVDSAAAWPNSTAFTGDNLKVVAGGCALTLTWPPTSNVEGYGQGGYGASTYGHFTPETNTPSYRVDVYSVNAHAVSSFVVNTGFFRYTLDQNSTDFNGAAGNMQFRVTPFNSYGDGPGHDTRTLNLFW